MMNRVWEDRKSEKGFTLTELLVVIAILGILAAVVVFAVGGINNRGQSSACSSDKQALQTAEEAYYAQNNHYTDVPGLLAANFLRTSSQWYTANSSTGAVTAISGNSGSCT
ncbi:MAG: prepilin-type N-terminal cleavage/methylation domain-containing protein [Actinobacteria bacterium]|nr:prepilin-type N-terminal cleavage/methylation domain-containing protein [Actinomycetota bacterium]